MNNKQLVTNLLSLLSTDDSKEKEADIRPSSITDSAIGEWVIIRSRNEGLNFGQLAEADHTGCVLNYAQRIWYHKPADTGQAWYEGVANSGLARDSKISPAVPQKIIIENYSITRCSASAVDSIRSIPHKTQS